MADAHVVLPAYAGMIHELEANVNKTVAVLPAYAGMIPVFVVIVHSVDGAPRVCGDDPRGWRGRGTTRPVLPAYAGMIPRNVR